MLNIMQMGGPFMWVIAACGVAAVLLSLRKGTEIFISQGLTEGPLRKGLDTILHLGLFGLVVGLFSQAYGIVLALDAIREAADISPQIVMQGLQVSFYAPLFGGIVFLGSLALWALFRYRVDSLLAIED